LIKEQQQQRQYLTQISSGRKFSLESAKIKYKNISNIKNYYPTKNVKKKENIETLIERQRKYLTAFKTYIET
jgi:hypothetical protein